MTLYLGGMNAIFAYISLATDASGSGWCGKLLSPLTTSVADYWTATEQGYDINTREAIALNKVLLSFADVLKDARVDAEIDNKAISFFLGVIRVVGV